MRGEKPQMIGADRRDGGQLQGALTRDPSTTLKATWLYSVGKHNDATSLSLSFRSSTVCIDCWLTYWTGAEWQIKQRHFCSRLSSIVAEFAIRFVRLNTALINTHLAVDVRVETVDSMTTYGAALTASMKSSRRLGIQYSRRNRNSGRVQSTRPSNLTDLMTATMVRGSVTDTEVGSLIVVTVDLWVTVHADPTTGRWCSSVSRRLMSPFNVYLKMLLRIKWWLNGRRPVRQCRV